MKEKNLKKKIYFLIQNLNRPVTFILYETFKFTITKNYKEDVLMKNLLK